MTEVEPDAKHSKENVFYTFLNSKVKQTLTQNAKTISP